MHIMIPVTNFLNCNDENNNNMQCSPTQSPRIHCARYTISLSLLSVSGRVSCKCFRLSAEDLVPYFRVCHSLSQRDWTPLDFRCSHSNPVARVVLPLTSTYETYSIRYGSLPSFSDIFLACPRSARNIDFTLCIDCSSLLALQATQRTQQL
jgi:hypothetical protein